MEFQPGDVVVISSAVSGGTSQGTVQRVTRYQVVVTTANGAEARFWKGSRRGVGHQLLTVRHITVSEVARQNSNGADVAADPAA